MRRRIAICIDDVGQHAGIHAAALQLVAQHRVCALSGMVHGPAWQDAVPVMRELASDVDVGLHLDLTETWGERRFRLPWLRLVVDACTRRVDEGALRAEIASQLDRFESAIGRAPDFVDGHRHVHQLPVVREVLVGELTRRYAAPRPWLRSTMPRAVLRDGVKPMIVAMLGAAAITKLAQRHGLRHNARLLGIHDFQADEEAYRHKLTRWLSTAHDGDLVLCHPARFIDATDPIGPARLVEHRVLASDWFGDALAKAHVEVVRMSMI